MALVVVIALSKQPLPAFSEYSDVSWYKYTGGFLGAFIVTVTLLSVAQIGAANMFVLVVAGQLITAVFMDHFGLLGMAVKPINLQKTIGILLLVAGAYLVNKK